MANARVKRIVNELEDILLDNEEFCAMFCADCPAIPHDFAEECPAGWRPCEPECYRRFKWQSVEEGLFDALS